MWLNPQKTAAWSRLLRKSLIENVIFFNGASFALIMFTYILLL